MPLIVKCAGCDEVLYAGEDIVEPREVIEKWDGKCPKCGRKLKLIPQKCEVKPYTEEGI